MAKIEDHRNSCTLLAVREVSGLDDEAIMAEFSRHKWVPGGGMYTQDWVAAAKGLGVEIEEIKPDWKGYIGGKYMPGYPTVAQMAKKYPTGTYILTASSHAFVLRDGVIVDQGHRNAQGGRRRVYECHRILNPRKVERQKITKVSRVKFITWPDKAKRLHTGSWLRYRAAFRLAQNDGLPLNEIISRSGYTWADALYDHRHGFIKIVE